MGEKYRSIYSSVSGKAGDINPRRKVGNALGTFIK